jgi:pSer/pThr/pTyr-binding forkhead associated (FHA) protein
MDVSKFHCAIAHHGDRIAVRDLKSTNGTFLNGQRLTRTAKASEGDVLKVGPLEFTFQFERDDSSCRGSESQLGWLMRSPEESESEILDPDQDTSIIEMFPAHAMQQLRAAQAAKTPRAYSKEATAVAGRFMRDYMATRKRPR